MNDTLDGCLSVAIIFGMAMLTCVVAYAVFYLFVSVLGK